MIDILLAIFIWSSSGPVIRFAGVGVDVLIFYSCIVSLLLQGPVLLCTGGWKEKREAGAFRLPVMLGAVGLVNTFSYYYALKHTTIANAVLTHYTAPVIVAFAAPLFLKEKIAGRAIAAIVIASAGLYLMLDGFTVGDSNTLGLASGLVSGFAYAAVIITARFIAGDFDPLLLTFIQNSVVAAMLAPFVRVAPTPGAIAYFILMGILYSTIAPVLYYRGMRSVAANRAAVLGYLEPVCAIILGILFLHELPGVHSLIGGGLILFSGYLTIRRDADGAVS